MRDARLFTKVFLPIGAAISAASCTHVTIDSGGGDRVVGVGITRIELPPTQGDLLAVDRTGIGFGWGSLPDNNAWLGFSESQWVLADPSKCQLLIIVRSPAQAENAEKILEQLEGKEPCIVDHTNTLQP